MMNAQRYDYNEFCLQNVLQTIRTTLNGVTKSRIGSQSF